MKKFWMPAVLSVLLPFAACAKKSASEGLTVAVSIFPMSDIVRQVAGTNLQVIYTLPAGANPHTFEPAPSVIERLSGCAAFIAVNDHIDGWAAKYFPNPANLYYLTGEDEGAALASPAPALRDMFSPSGMQDLPMSGNVSVEDNPHVWLSVRIVRSLLPRLVVILSNIDPAHFPQFLTNAANYYAELGVVDKEISSTLSPYRGMEMIEWHPSWDYFAADYGLAIAGAIERGEGQEPSARDFERLTERGKTLGVKVILLDSFAESRLVDTMASELGAQIVYMDSLGNPLARDELTYADIMIHNADALAAAFGKVKTGE